MNNEQKQNILISGGHLTPAVAFIDYSIVENFGFKFFFAGRKYAQKKTRQLSHEEQAMAERGVDFINFDSVNADNFEWRELRKAVKQARKIIKENDINLFLSFGGYLAVPFAIAAWLEKVPVITHEQTQVLGKANKLVALFANKVAMSSPTTKTIFANKKVVTGNPLRPKLFQKSGEPPIWFKNFDSKLPYLYISGGSQGSKAINENVAEVLSELTKNFVVIHQIGATSKVRDPALEVAKILEKHSPIQKQNYFSRPYLSEVELSFLYPKISIALARAGANSVAELSAFRIPTLYIPLPLANYDEQTKNAQAIVDQNGALLMNQKDLSPETLLKQLQILYNDRDKFRTAFGKKPYLETAAPKLADLVIQVLAEKYRVQKNSSNN